jgi:hypothetical protein
VIPPLSGGSLLDELARVVPDVPLERLAELATLSDAFTAAEVRQLQHRVLPTERL